MPCAVCRRQLFFYNLQYWRDTSQKLCFTEFSAYREENKANLSLPLDVQKLKNLSASETFAPLPLLGNSKWRNGVLLAGVLTPVDRRHVKVYSVQRRQYPREAARRLISLPLHGNEIKRRSLLLLGGMDAIRRWTEDTSTYLRPVKVFGNQP